MLGTIPIAILGLAFKDPIENEFRNLYLIGAALIVFGLVMAYVDETSKRERGIESLDARDGMFVGVRAGARARAGRLALGRDTRTELFLDGVERLPRRSLRRILPDADFGINSTKLDLADLFVRSDVTGDELHHLIPPGRRAATRIWCRRPVPSVSASAVCRGAARGPGSA